MALSLGRSKRARALAGLLLSLLAAVTLHAASPACLAIAQAPDPFEIPLDRLKRKDPENVVRFTMASVQDLDTAGAATVKLVTRDGFKIYDKGLEFTYVDASGKTTALSFTPNPAAARIQDPNYNEPRDVHLSSALFRLALPPLVRGDGSVVVRFEACSVSMCLLPTRFSVPLLEGARGVPVKKKQDDIASIAIDPAASAASQQSRLSAGDDPFAGIAGEGAEAQIKPVTKHVPMEATAAAPVATPQGSLSASDSASLWVRDSMLRRSWTLFPALFLAGLLMNLTPCVYPMIPITLNVLSQFGAGFAASDEQKRRRRRLLPFAYVLGMVIAYSLVGVAAGMSGTIFGSLLQSQAVTIALAAVMVLLGLSMLDVFNLSAVQSLGNKIPITDRHPVIGVVTMGAVSGLVSAPCTGPVLSTILVLIGQSKDPVYGFTLMLFYALGFGAPYVALGLFTQKLGRLPKAGGLLNAVKFVFAALMFALALYYLKPILGRVEAIRWIFARPSFSALFAGVLFALVSLMFGRLQPSAVKAARIGSLAALTALCLWLTLWVTSGFVSLEPDIASTTSAKNARSDPNGVHWMTDWDQALVRATVERKPMLVDAWAEWCSACLHMDATVWKDPRVVEILNERFVPVKLDFTRSAPFTDRITEVWELSGLPAVAFFPPGSNLKGAPPTLFREAITTEKFLETAAPFLAKGQATDQGNTQ